MAYHEQKNKHAKQTGKNTSKILTKLDKEHKKQTKMKMTQFIICEIKEIIKGAKNIVKAPNSKAHQKLTNEEIKLYEMISGLKSGLNEADLLPLFGEMASVMREAEEAVIRAAVQGCLGLEKAVQGPGSSIPMARKTINQEAQPTPLVNKNTQNHLLFAPPHSDEVPRAQGQDKAQPDRQALQDKVPQVMVQPEPDRGKRGIQPD